MTMINKIQNIFLKAFDTKASLFDTDLSKQFYFATGIKAQVEDLLNHDKKINELLKDFKANKSNGYYRLELIRTLNVVLEKENRILKNWNAAISQYPMMSSAIPDARFDAFAAKVNKLNNMYDLLPPLKKA